MRPPESIDDRGLVARAKAGHMDAFEELIRRHQRAIYGLCHRLTGAHQTADDLSQEAFIKAYFGLPRFMDGMEFYPWIRRIALNGCLNHLKKRNRERAWNEEGHSSRPDAFRAPDEPPQDTIERSETERKFQEVFSALPPDAGVVILEAITDQFGRVISCQVLRCIPLLDQAAIDAVRQWLYEPMVINGRPRGVIITVTVTFELKEP